MSTLRERAVKISALMLCACNDAPLWPDDAWAPNGSAPWYHPSDEACDRQFPDEEEVIIEGYRYCGVEEAISTLVPVDDPLYTRCSSIPTDADQDVMYVFNGVRARAFIIANMYDREILHTDWDGEPVIVNYCRLVAGGDVLRRQVVDGEGIRYNVVGLWGSANTVAPRSELFRRDYTVYSTWDGHALLGPGAPGSLEPFPALIDYVRIDEFVAQFGILGDACEVWTGQETLGVGCAEACAHFGTLCAGSAVEQCAQECAKYPRMSADCLLAAETCEGARICQ